MFGRTLLVRGGRRSDHGRTSTRAVLPPNCSINFLGMEPLKC